MISLKLADDDLVAVFQQNVLLQAPGLGDFVVVEVEDFAAAEDFDLLGVGEFAEASRVAQRFQDSGGRNQPERASAVDFPDDVILFASNFRDEHRDIRVVEILSEQISERLSQLHGSGASGGNLSDKRHGNLAVRTDSHRHGEIRFAPDFYEKNVFRADQI